MKCNLIFNRDALANINVADFMDLNKTSKLTHIETRVTRSDQNSFPKQRLRCQTEWIVLEPERRKIVCNKYRCTHEKFFVFSNDDHICILPELLSPCTSRCPIKWLQSNTARASRLKRIVNALICSFAPLLNLKQ